MSDSPRISAPDNQSMAVPGASLSDELIAYIARLRRFRCALGIALPKLALTEVDARLSETELEAPALALTELKARSSEGRALMAELEKFEAFGPETLPIEWTEVRTEVDLTQTLFVKFLGDLVPVVMGSQEEREPTSASPLVPATHSIAQSELASFSICSWRRPIAT